MRGPLPLAAAALGVPVEVAPAWLTARGRPTFEVGTSLAELKAGCRTAAHLATEISAKAVQEAYARRCRALCWGFLDFLSYHEHDVRAKTLGEKMAMYGAQMLMSKAITRSSTMRTYLAEATRCWPSALRATPVQEFLRGLETISPALPEAAGISLAREVDRTAVRRWMEYAARRGEQFQVAIATGLLAGLRMREAARLLMREGSAVFCVCKTDGRGEVTWKEKAATKTNLRGTRILADRTAWVPLAVVPLLQQLPLPWRATEEEAARLVRVTAEELVAAGVPGDMRVFRRALAIQVRDTLVSEGESEEEATRWARAALGHKANSPTTYRYLGTALSRQGVRRLAAACRGTT